MVGSRGTLANSRKAHDVPVRAVVTKNADTYDIVRDKSRLSGRDVSAIAEMDQVSSKTLQRMGTRTRQVPLCWHGAQCAWLAPQRSLPLLAPRGREASPTVQEQVNDHKIPEVQIVEQIQEQIVETSKVNPLERVQQRAVEQSVSLFERLHEFGKRLEKSLARPVRKRRNDQRDWKVIGRKTCN